MKTRYQQTADETEKYWQKVQTGRAETLLVAHQKAYIKVRHTSGRVGGEGRGR